MNRDEKNLWLPPRRLRRYQILKTGAGILAAAIFIFWILQLRQNIWMIFFAVLLVIITAWVTVASILRDMGRARRRQIAVHTGALLIESPTDNLRVELEKVHHAQWRHDSESTLGLWLFDKPKTVLAHIDGEFLADEAEARAFLQWLRERTGRHFKVQWPEGVWELGSGT